MSLWQALGPSAAQHSVPRPLLVTEVREADSVFMVTWPPGHVST